ncbi:arabinofuranan 3-O-arabinosyltransferase [Actinocorallia herbida]|uniref:Arabinofuranan 3-O-arabinosyltransferase n=1 Tax=Actinocorallia herbida TaxID=58109 RepID=A0A3N1D8S3_9ACTN|nr:arabinofuranan 3-O-arabinosyltransferase [Actinocorallia herbida]
MRTESAGPAVEAAAVPLLRHRLRLGVAALLLVTLTFLTRPGELIADTKIDFALDPAGFVARSLHAWDVNQLGQIQNQANGYLFPMAEFFLGGRMIGLEGWVVQRLWMALLAVTAFAGLYRLAGRLGIGTPDARMIAALSYALAPRVMSDLGVLSSEVQPVALLPWILLPLVAAARGGGRVGAAARSAVAVALCGGVNAASVVAVLVVPFLYLVTRDREAAKWRLLGWWTAMVAVATLWWTVPLALMGGYAFSFLPYTETTATITPVTSLLNVLRGTPDWVAWLTGSGGPTLPVGHALATTPWLVALTALVAAAGLAGLTRRDAPERLFLTLTLLTGIVVVSAGHIGVLEPAIAGPVRDLLDGPLAPLRNLRKFDPVLRLPLALGLAHLLASVRPRAVAAVVVALAATAAPAVQLGLAGPGPIRQVPAYWTDAATWLNARTGQQAVLSLPGSRFAEYLWGRPLDEPLQQLSEVRWVQRQIGAAGSVGLTRVLDAVDRRVATGRGGPGLADVLGRVGVRYVLVRNDLDRVELTGAWPARVHQALTDSPGLTKVAQFGPPTTGGYSTDDAVGGLDQEYPALEVYEVAGAAAAVSLQSASALLHVDGAPEALLDLADEGLLETHRPTVLNDDAAGLPAVRAAATVGTDSLRARLRHFGLLRTGLSPTLTDGEEPRDYLEPPWADYRTTARYTGVKAVSASSSASDPDALSAQQQTGSLPFAALDDDLRTSWRSGGWSGAAGQWWRVDFDAPREVSGTRAVLVPDEALGPAPVRISVETEHGVRTQTVRTDREEQVLLTPPGATSWLRVRFIGFTTAQAAELGASVALSEVRVPGVVASRTLKAPEAPATSWVFSRGSDEASACMRGADRWICHWSLERGGEEAYGFDRAFAAAAGRVRLTGRAVLRETALVDHYTRLRPLPEAGASSQAVDGAAAWARAAFDDDPSTTWLPDPDDDEPTLTLRWSAAQQLTRITVERPPAAEAPIQVYLTGDDGEVRGGVLDDTGMLRFAALRTKSLRISFATAAENVQVTEVRVPGVSAIGTTPDAAFALPCGFGPILEVNGGQVATRAEGTYGDVLAGRPLRFTSCAKVSLAEGENRITVSRYGQYRIDGLVVGREALPEPSGSAGSVRIGSWSATSRTVEVAADEDALLMSGENFNRGWTATVGGEALKPVRVDGWRQGWWVPAGTKGTVTLSFGPDRAYRTALLAGAAGLVLVAGIALVRRRPARRTGTAAAPIALPVLLTVPLGAAAGYWTASWPGAAVGIAAVLLPGRLRRLDPSWTAAALLALAGGAAAVHGLLPGGLGASLAGAVPQLLCCAAVGLLVAAAADRPAGAEPPDRLLEEPVGQPGGREGDEQGEGEQDAEGEGQGVHPRSEQPDEHEQEDRVPQVDPVGDAAEPGHGPAAEEDGEPMAVAGVQGQRGDEKD